MFCSFCSTSYNITQLDDLILVSMNLHMLILKRCHRLAPSSVFNFFFKLLVNFCLSSSCKGHENTCSFTIPSLVFNVISGKAPLSVEDLEIDTEIPEPSSGVI